MQIISQPVISNMSILLYKIITIMLMYQVKLREGIKVKRIISDIKKFPQYYIHS